MIPSCTFPEPVRRPVTGLVRYHKVLIFHMRRKSRSAGCYHGKLEFRMAPTIDWLPKSYQALRQYDRRKLLADAIAGVTVGLVAVPLAMAFAIASGLTPQAGLYCAAVAGFLISALGGSATQIGGPTGAFAGVIYGVVAR